MILFWNSLKEEYGSVPWLNLGCPGTNAGGIFPGELTESQWAEMLVQGPIRKLLKSSGVSVYGWREWLTFGEGPFVIHFRQWHIRCVGVHQEHLLIVAELKFSIERVYNRDRAVGLLECNGYQESKCGKNKSFLRAGSTLHLPFELPSLSHPSQDCEQYFVVGATYLLNKEMSAGKSLYLVQVLMRFICSLEQE